jgi:alpha-beta hydrolase superfamily lysophospholipase
MRHTTGTIEGEGGEALYEQAWLPDDETRAAIALVHGLGEHSSRYGEVTDALVPHGFAFYSFDLRGHGRSPGARGHIMSWAQYREDVRRLVRRVGREQPDVPLFLYGHSMGGLIVLEYALRDPSGVQGVIASAPALGIGPVSPFLQGLGRVLSRLYPRFSLEVRFADDHLTRDPEVAAAYENDHLLHSRVSARLYTEIAAAMAWTQANAARWQLPLLIVHGDEDRVVPIESSRQFFERVPIADKEYRLVHGGYHEPHNDLDRQQVLKDITEWLERHR